MNAFSPRKSLLGTGLGLYLLAATTGSGHAKEPETGWQFERDQDGIQVQTRPVAGFDVIEVQGSTTLRTDVDQLLALYRDPDRCVDWIPSCAESHRVSQSSDERFSLYRRLANPFPFKDRDYVLDIVVQRDTANGEVVIRYQDNKTAPENRCCVRMDRLVGFWRFTPMADGRVAVLYRAHLLPGGGFPDSIVNKSVPDMPFNTLTALKREIESRRHKP